MSVARCSTLGEKRAIFPCKTQSIAVFFFGCLAMHPIFSFSIEELVKWVLERRDRGFTKWTVQFTDGSKTVLHLPKAEMTTDQTLALIKAQLKGQL